MRQPGSSSGRARGGLRIATAICCVLAWALPSTVWAQDAAAPQPPGKKELRLDLPAWNPDPATLPAELRPLDIVRPALPEDAAAEVEDLEERMEELEERGLTAETRESQDATLDEAIGLAEWVLAIRAEHQTAWQR